MRRRSQMLSSLAVAALVASCSLVARTPAATPGPPASAVASDLRTFDEGGLTFAYPAAWREFHYAMTSSFSNQIAYLATVDIPEPCTTTVDPSFTTTECPTGTSSRRGPWS